MNRSDINDSNVKITNITPQYFYEDQDGDGHGNPDQYLYHSVKPDTGNYVTQATDCDDTDALLHDFTLWYIDQDQDGKGYNPTKLEQTNLLRGTPDKNIAPSTVSITITGCYSGNLYVLNQDDFDDQDSDITDTLPEYYYKDSDGDQYGVEDQAKLFSQKPNDSYAVAFGDCNDSDALIHPETLWYLDSDGDSWGDSEQTLQQCEQPENYVLNKEDHDDTTEKITNIAPQDFYRDQDGDDYGDPNDHLRYSEKPEGYVINNLDCNDSDTLIHPQTVWYLDSDGDGWGGRLSQTQCISSTGYVLNSQDYDDSTDKIDNIAPRRFYRDQDGDQFGDINNFVFYSHQPQQGYVSDSLDCDDNNASYYPNKKWYMDSDGDSWGDPQAITNNAYANKGSKSITQDNYSDIFKNHSL